MTVLNFLL